MNQREDLVRDIPLLVRLSESDRGALASWGRVRSYPAGAIIFREGDPGDSLHIIIEGSVRIAVLSPAGEEAAVALLGPGECFGDLALLDGRPRSASAIASHATKTLVVTRNAFMRWLAERPKAALALLETLSLRMRRTDEALADLAFLDLPHRLAKRLLDLAIAHPEVRAKGHLSAGVVRLRITQSELASMLGVSRESVNRQLNLFAREGWIVLARGSVTLTDAEALRTFA
jgi:CRP-like cAMP-binding protein